MSLVAACVKSDLAKVTLLIKQNYKLNVKGRYGETPIFYVSGCNSAEIAEQLLKYGARTDIKDIDGNTPLHSCLDIKVTEKLLKYGANPNSLNKRQQTPLFLAVKHRKLDIAARLILISDVNAKDVDDRTPAYNAVYNGDLNMVKLLVEHGASVDGLIKHTTSYSVLKYLLSIGQNIKDVEPLLYLPLDVKTLELLLQHGINKDIIDVSGEPPIIVHARRLSIEHVKLLVNFGANVNFHPKTILMSVIDCSHNYNILGNQKINDLIAYLVKLVDDIDAEDKDGMRALDFASVKASSSENMKNIVELLLSDGATPNPKFNYPNLAELYQQYAVFTKPAFK